MSHTYRKGDKVRYIGTLTRTRCAPRKGTVGTVTQTAKFGLWVQWPKGSTSDDDHWWCAMASVEPLKIEGGETNA